MSDTVITVENLSKRYVIGRQRSKDDGLRHVLQDAAMASWRWLRRAASSNGANGQSQSPISDLRVSGPLSRDRIVAERDSLRPQRGSQGQPSTSEEFWALRDVNLKVKQGEVVGIIGRNGAGKSTLLKILSRITEPTAGRIHLKGRVASLLEVGTGFHPELTGRENIFLNGAILGMTRLEIRRKFDEIVAFAEIEKFLDTPVKRYSSGMYVRLAFAVAAHLEPEMLIVDEVLAVGDASFQKKCLSKMQDVGKDGRTVLFVSHNMAAVQSLCTRAICLRDGEVVEDAPVDQAMATYANSVQQRIDGLPLSDRLDRVGSNQVRLVEVQFLDAATGARRYTLLSGQDVLICIHFVCLAQQPIENVSFVIGFFALNGTYLFACDSEVIEVYSTLLPAQVTAFAASPSGP